MVPFHSTFSSPIMIESSVCKNNYFVHRLLLFVKPMSGEAAFTFYMARTELHRSEFEYIMFKISHKDFLKGLLKK
jgi:hypothetical protein